MASLLRNANGNGDGWSPCSSYGSLPASAGASGVHVTVIAGAASAPDAPTGAAASLARLDAA